MILLTPTIRIMTVGLMFRIHPELRWITDHHYRILLLTLSMERATEKLITDLACHIRTLICLGIVQVIVLGGERITMMVSRQIQEKRCSEDAVRRIIITVISLKKIPIFPLWNLEPRRVHCLEITNLYQEAMINTGMVRIMKKNLLEVVGMVMWWGKIRDGVMANRPLETCTIRTQMEVMIEDMVTVVIFELYLESRGILMLN